MGFKWFYFWQRFDIIKWYIGEIMFDSPSRFPKIFVYMLTSIAIIMFIGMFFSLELVSIIYFLALLISVVVLILDRKYGTILTNYKLTFFLFDLINLIAVIAITYYEYTKHTLILNIFLISLIVMETLLMVLDIFFIHNKNLTKAENLLVDSVKFGSMICILTYFFGVSILFYAIDALAFEIANFVLKIYVNRNPEKNTEKEKDLEENNIVKLIRTNSDEREID